VNPEMPLTHTRQTGSNVDLKSSADEPDSLVLPDTAGEVIRADDFFERQELGPYDQTSPLLAEGRETIASESGDRVARWATRRFLSFTGPKANEYFKTLQQWEGYVLGVSQDVFRARLIDVGGGQPDETAEVLIDEIEEEDRALIKTGAVFYWTIGYLDRPSGRIRASVIRFRRLPTWTDRELHEASALADRWRGILDTEEQSAGSQRYTG
jgi:hypothetical protein